jgi:hypothetical protein
VPIQIGGRNGNQGANGAAGRAATGATLSPSARRALPALGANQKLPPLVNQRAAAANAALANARVAPPEQTGPGALFPALVIGLGHFGLLVLQRLRRTLRERFGNTPLPHVRMLYVDTEPDTLQTHSSSAPPVNPADVYLARLNRPSHYSQARADLPPVANWLNPQMLYRIPRQPETAGMRAFGRLAFCDHYRAIMTKVRAELEACTAQSALAESAEATRLAMRTNYPRVYVVTSLMGGTGSGMFIDMAYALRMQLKLLGYKRPEVHGLLFAPQVEKDTPRSQAVANSYAALSELLHYNSPTTQYEALFDTGEGPIVERERPFRRCLMLQLPPSADPSALRPVLGTGTGFLFQEMFTPVGREADKARGESSKAGSTPPQLQTCGTFRLTWPRRSLLERSARRACARLVAGWASKGSEHLSGPVAVWLDEQWPRLQVDAEATLARLWEAFSAEGDPAQQLSETIDPLDHKDRHSSLELSDLCPALERITYLVGQPEADVAAGGGRHGQTLEQLARTIATETEKRLAGVALSVVEQSGWRLAGAEEIIRQLTARLKQTPDPLEAQVPKLHQESREIYVKAFNALKALETMSRGSRKKVAVRDALTHMRQYAQKRLDFLTQRALLTTLKIIAGFGPECQRDVQLLRQRLESMRDLLSRPGSGAAHGHMGPERPVLPPGCRDADAAAERMVASLGVEELSSLEHALLAQIRKRCRSFVEFARDHAGESRGMTAVLVEEARTFMEPRLQSMSPAAVILAGGSAATAQQEAQSAFEQAKPALGSARGAATELSVISVPAGPEGAQFAAIVEEALPDQRLMVVGGTDDIIFHREVQGLEPADLPQVGPFAREAFAQITQADQVSPHARQDVTWRAIGQP